MQLLSDMKPTFLRLPGGNFLEGDTIADRFPWKKTIGPLEQRPGHRGCWRYGANDGMGLLEFMEWCEDLHIQPVLAVYAGYSLKGEHVDAGPALQPFVDDALDEIEYVTGDADHQMGRRAREGWPSRAVPAGLRRDRQRGWRGQIAQLPGPVRPILRCDQGEVSEPANASTPAGRSIGTTLRQRSERTPDVIDEHYYRNAWQMEDDAAHYDTL